MWQVPVTTELCGRCWMLFWADGPPSTGDRHTNFTLSSSGGSVGLFTSVGTLIDYLTYPVLPTDYSFGRFPDGGSDLRVFSTVTHTAANNVPPTSLILNEYNAVSPLNLLKNLGSDTQFSRIPGNGGDWFELVVTENLLDITGWQLELRNDAGGVGETLQTLTFSAHSLWQTLRSGSIITISEELADDLSYDPQAGDWTINARAADSGTGSLITAQDFEVSNVNWQLTIKDDQGIVQFGPAGEGVWRGSRPVHHRGGRLQRRKFEHLRGAERLRGRVARAGFHHVARRGAAGAVHRPRRRRRHDLRCPGQLPQRSEPRSGGRRR
jgi:hypothetical protein